MEHRLPDHEPWFNNHVEPWFNHVEHGSLQQQNTRETEIEKFTTLRSWRKYATHLEGPHEMMKAECRQREKQDLGHKSLIESMGGVVWISWAKTVLVNSDQKEQGFDKFHRGLIKGTHKGKTLGGGRDLITSAVGEVISGTMFAFDSVGCYLGHTLAWGG